MELFEEIRREYEHGEKTVKGVARKLGIHRRMVREALGSAVPRGRKVPEREKPKLAAAMPLIDAILEADRKVHRKQRHTARRIFRRLRVEHSEIDVAESTVREYGFIEHRLEDRFQPIEQRLLAHPVINRRDSQRAKLARLSRLRDLYLPHRLRLVGIFLQIALQPIQLLTQLRGESCQTLPVHAPTAPVGLYHLPGHLQILPLIHLVESRCDAVV